MREIKPKEKYIEYKDLPVGFKELIGATTAPRGFKWYWNGKGFFSSENKIILVKMPVQENLQLKKKYSIPIQMKISFEKEKNSPKPKQRYADENTRKTLNELARHQLKSRLLADICMDIQICSIEHWEWRDYIKGLIKELKEILERN